MRDVQNTERRFGEEELSSIRKSHGDDITAAAQQLIEEGKSEGLSFIELVTAAECRHFERNVGSAEQLANERTDSRFELADPADDTPQ